MNRTKQRIKKTVLTVVLLLAVVIVQVAEVFSLKAFAAEPSVVVSNFSGLYSAIMNAQDGDIIGINDVISISASNITVGDADKHVTIVRMDAGAFLDIASNHATIQNITFDGNGIAAYYPMCQANYHTDFVNDSFHDCKNADGSGGAIRGVNGNINLTGCTFTNNEAVNGGHAFFQDDVTLTIQNCTFTGGHASTDGGGLYIQTSQVNNITGSTITGNTADRIGGGILNQSSLTITDSRVYSNTATVGGADIANRSGFNVMVEHDMEALAPLFADLNLLPVEWVNDFNSEAGVSVDGFEPTVANTFLKLTLQEITEDPGEDPGTGGGSEDPEDPSGTELGTGAEEPSGTEDPGTSTGGTEEPSQDPSETPSGNESGSGTEQGGTETPSETPTDDPGSGSSESGSNTSTEDNGSNQGSSDAPGTASETPGSSTSTTTDSNNASTTSTSTSSTTDSHDSTATTSTTSNSSDNNSSSADSHNSTTSSTDSHNSTSSTDNHSVTNNYYTNPERTSEPATQQPQVTVVNNIPSSAVQSSEDGQKQQEQNLVQQDNIRIQANGVNVTYEVIDGVHSISINSVQDAQPVIQTMSDSELVPGASAPSDDRTGVNFYEIAKLVLLAGIMVTLLWKRKEKN